MLPLNGEAFIVENKNMLVFVAILGVIGLFVIGVPITEVQLNVTYTTTEAQTRTLMSFTSATGLEAGYSRYWSPDVDAETNIQFVVSASDTVDVMILTLSQYNNFKDGESYDYERKASETKSATLSYYTSMSGTYYFVIQNIHTGFFGFGEKDIVINSVSLTATSDIEVTKYRTETKKVTIMEKITGNY